MNRSTFVGWLCAALFAGAGSAQTHIYTLDEPYGRSAFGAAMAPLGDLDRDGFADALIGSPLSGKMFGGCVYLLSGKVGTLRPIGCGAAGGDMAGAVVVGCEDVDGDTYPDFAYGIPSFGGGLGSFAVVSGKSGVPLLSAYGPVRTSALGSLLGNAGDLDGDGRNDVIVGQPGPTASGNPGGAWVYSLAPTKLLYTILGDATFAVWASVDGVGDLDGDGRDDFLVSGSAVRFYSGRTGGVIRMVQGQHAGGLGDLDGDRRGDYWIATGGGQVRIFSGASHQLLVTLSGSRATRGGDLDGDGTPDVLVHDAGRVLGYSGKTRLAFLNVPGGVMAAAGDLNGDGHDDLLVASGTSTQVTAYSPRELPLWTDRHILSIGAQDAQTFTMDATPQRAGQSYLMVGSVSGTRPGLDLPGNIHVPLNLDPYTDITIGCPGSFLVRGCGQLDVQGMARPVLQLPPGLPPAAVGLVAHHACVVLNASATWFDLVSNAVPLCLVR